MIRHTLRTAFLLPCLGLLVLFGAPLRAQSAMSPWVGETFWNVTPGPSITWKVAAEKRLPHSDNIEMSGRRVSGIIEYSVDKSGHVSVQRDLIFPQLRIFPYNDSPEWFNYRAYLRHTYTDLDLPALLVDDRQLQWAPLQEVRIDGTLRLVHQPVDGIRIERRLLPSMTERLFVEHWEITNTADTARRLTVLPVEALRTRRGAQGEYRLRVRTHASAEPQTLAPGARSSVTIYFEASADGEEPTRLTPPEVVKQRELFIQEVQGRLALETPDPVLNTLFTFSKIRAAECIYESALGLIHSPSGGNYYVGVWANDQVEYSGPFFPYLGYQPGLEAALNAYEVFQRNLPEPGKPIWSSFEMEGTLPCCGKDRGDAAMLAYGAAHYALGTGERSVGERLWPLISWGLEYSHRQLNEAGVVRSTTDEMEGRIPTGTANLATSSLYYAALTQATRLARALGKDPAVAADFEQRAARLAKAIEAYFGATIDGLQTYRYFEGHQAFRHWIGLPLAFGLHGRREDTLKALFDRMWTTNGVRVELTPGQSPVDLFWDRGTLYALRGAFVSGGTEIGLKRLREYSTTRLTGFRVPYTIEAWPENNMRHLSAESALYCRVFTEGLLGIVPTSFDALTLQPRLPAAWREKGYRLRNLHLLGRSVDVNVTKGRSDQTIRLIVAEGGLVRFDEDVRDGQPVEVGFR